MIVDLLSPPLRSAVPMHAPANAKSLRFIVAAGPLGCTSSPVIIDAGAGDFRTIADATTGGTDGPAVDLATPIDLAMARARDLAVACPGTFPMFDKSCSTAADCFIARHQ